MDGLVHVRTPTYRRPAALRRALDSVIAQSWPNWVVDIYDDDPDQAGRTVVESFGDTRLRYHHNRPQRFASRNIDACFSADNPHAAEYFCVVEDDNFLLPGFMAENIALSRQRGVEIVLRNQLVEHASGTADARLGEGAVLDGLFVEGTYAPEQFRMSLLVGIGVSNGGLFWSRRAKSKLEIGFPCTATMQEYLRTYSIVEPIHVAMTPLAVWAENAGQTTRNVGLDSSYLRRELDLKREIQTLQRAVWNESPAEARRAFMQDGLFVPPATARAKSLTKALIPHPPAGLSPRVAVEMALRGVAIRALGRLSPEFQPFIESRRSA